MTKNEQKAKEITNDLADCAKGEMNKLYVSTAAYAAAMKMAEWKDEQFKEEKKHLSRVFKLYKAGFVTRCACGKEVPFELFVMAESLERAQELVINHPRFQNDVDAYLRYIYEIKLEDYFDKVLN